MLAMFRGGGGLSARHDSGKGSNIQVTPIFNILWCSGVRVDRERDIKSQMIKTYIDGPKLDASDSTLPVRATICQRLIA